MALHPDFPESPYSILDPAVRWFPADEALRASSMEKLMPPLVPQLRARRAPAVDDTRNCDDVASYLESNYPDLKNAVLECRLGS